jgi:hypothetical protein
MTNIAAQATTGMLARFDKLNYLILSDIRKLIHQFE